MAVKKPVAKKVTKKPVEKSSAGKLALKKACLQEIVDCDCAIAHNQYRRAQAVARLNDLDPKSIVVNL